MVTRIVGDTVRANAHEVGKSTSALAMILASAAFYFFRMVVMGADMFFMWETDL